MHVSLLEVGACAPNFELPDEANRRVRLSERLKHGSVLLYFYPTDSTLICTREACAFRDLHAQLRLQGTEIIGISPQNSTTHAHFREQHGLSFTLLADPKKRVIRAYGCVGPLGLGIRRVTYLVDRGGRIADRVHAALRISRHLALANRTLDRP